MKLFDILFCKEKKPENSAKYEPHTAARKPATMNPQSTASVNIIRTEICPQNNQNTATAKARPLGYTEIHVQALIGSTCADDAHDFAHPYPFKCRKCGLPLQWDSQHISKYMGSYFGDVSYQWTRFMDKNDIVSFSVSAGDRPVFSANCDFSNLIIRNCFHGSRDGWMQSQYPSNYFEPREVALEDEDIQRLRDFFNSCNFSTWRTPVHYVENHEAPGFSVDESFRCTFADGKQFACLDPDNAEFEHLVSLVREIAGNNSKKEDQAFVQRMLEDTEKKEKQIYWLISQSLEEKWMELMAQGVPFFNYIVAREMSRGDNANAELMVNVIRFSDGAAWVTEKAVPESEYQWEALPQGKGNDAGAAFALLTRHFETLPEPGRKLFPIVALVLDGPITDDWLAAQARFQSLPGVNKNVLTIALALGDRVEKKFLKKFDGVIYHINSMEDIINEMDSPLFGF